MIFGFFRKVSIIYFLACCRAIYSNQWPKAEKIEHNIICGPSTSKLVGNFLIQRYLDARSELGMADASKRLYDRKVSSYYDNLRFVLLHLFGFNPEVVVFLTTKGIVIPYLRLFKCANEGISANLFILTVSKSTILANGIRLNAKNEFTKDMILNSLQHNHEYRNITKPTFTFVREPIQRFMSGFTETIFKHYLKYKITNTDGSRKRINESEAKDYLMELLDFRSSLWDVEHMFPMSGAFFQFHVPLVGSVEQMKVDWEMKIKPTYEINATYNNKLGVHDTSVYHPLVVERKGQSSRDPNGARAVIKSILNNDIRYSRAICQLILIDYVCLPMYALPPKCMFLNSTRHAAMEAVRLGRVVPRLPTTTT